MPPCVFPRRLGGRGSTIGLGHLVLLLAILLAPARCLAGTPNGASQDYALSSPAAIRKSFNAACQALKEGKYREAEALLESIVTTQSEEFQPPALYNMAHARFAMGVEELKKVEEAGPAAARARAGAMRTEQAISDGREALGDNDLNRLIQSYMAGRGELKEIRGSIKAIQRALQTYGNVLKKWERASADWKSAHELDPQNLDAKHNAEIADRHIARLIDSIRDLQQALAAMQAAREQLKEVMRQMRGRIPEQNMPPGAPGEEDEEEEGENSEQPPQGQEEAPSQEGRQRPMSPEEASWLLDGFRSGEERRLPMGQEEEGKPRDRKRPSW